MQLKWLEDFICLNELRSFRRSADQRNVSQSAFSRRIQALEEWVGASLVDRSSYPLELTLAGKELVNAAEQISASIYRAKEDILLLQRNSENDIVLATHPSLAVTFVPELLKHINTSLDGLTYRIRNDLLTAEFYLSSLVQGTCDYLICYQHVATKFWPEKDVFPSRTIGSETLLPVAAQHADIQAWSAPNLLSLPMVCYSPYTNLGKVINHTLQGRWPDIEFSVVAEASVADTVKAMVLSGHGLAWLPSSLIQTELNNQSLIRINRFSSIDVDIAIYRHNELRQNALFIWDQLSAYQAPS